MNPEERLLEPINLTELENKGVISQEDGWYRIHRFEDLPEQAGNQIAKLEQDEKGIKVMFIEQVEYATNVRYLDEHIL